ncbi:putative n amino acid transport system protein [Phaeoacremonium minimum UCRPA7]|uniref:Putative n amino acid transport system protein n=1 Tax=Phaeoacremonium minimum (strain UCR-PA7) TaxID=1286976 RepID=R8BHK3_PHAM7|nr:putative n amino acid transport system protein [Phaeoacremonium minimum UCRPA7]EON98742.1 putative n amino acid transport system protein [Phaeoacremonium minimum UCRPA7]
MSDQYTPPNETFTQEKKPINRDTEAAIPRGRAGWFGGSDVAIGPRIGPVLSSISIGDSSDTDDSSSAILHKQKALEDGHAIQYRTCSWQKTAALLFSEYICLAIMSFPWSYSVLGLVPGLILTVFVALVVLYTSLVLWEFCLRHPEVRDVCDIGQMLFWNKKWAWWFTAIMFILNNTFIQGLHVLVGAKYLNTMTASDDGIACRTVSFSVIMFILCWLCSLPRTFNMLAKLGTLSAFFTFVSVLLATVFAGVQDHPAGYDPRPSYTTEDGTEAVGGNPIVTALPVAGTTFVAALSAFLNISYTFIGQITLPSFIAEMKEPRDFPKALWACTILEILVFSVVGAVVYAYVGNQYMTAPAFGSLDPLYKKVAFSFMIPTLIFLGVLYASVSARFVFFRIFQNSHHKNDHTVVGWGTWALILLATWILAFIIAEVIPFFSDLLSLMSSLFDSFFGFIFWGVAYFRMRKADGTISLVKERTAYGYAMAAMNIFIIAIGVFFLSVGTYASVQSIINDFEAGAVGAVFTCKSNGL